MFALLLFTMLFADCVSFEGFRVFRFRAAKALLWIVLQVLTDVERGGQQENVGSRRKDDVLGRNVGIPHKQAELLHGKWKSGHEMYYIPPVTVNSHVSLPPPISLHWHIINTALHFNCTWPIFTHLCTLSASKLQPLQFNAILYSCRQIIKKRTKWRK